MSISRHQPGNRVLEFLKVTIRGGILFLLPLVLVVVLLEHGMRLAGNVVHPIAKYLNVDAVLGPVGDQVLAILILVAISIAAGLAARTGAGRGMMRWSVRSHKPRRG